MYKPYGMLSYSTGSTPTDLEYTGQVLDSSGLLYYNARYYDRVVGQFTSGDFVQGPNRYAYVGGNPETYTDPSGHMPDDILHDGDGGDAMGVDPVGFYTVDSANYTQADQALEAQQAAQIEAQAEEMTQALDQPALTNPSAYSQFDGNMEVATTMDSASTNTESLAQEIEAYQQEQGSLQEPTNTTDPTNSNQGNSSGSHGNSSPGSGSSSPEGTSSTSNTLVASQKTASWSFSPKGDFEGQTIGDVTQQLQSGDLGPENVPVQYLERGGTRLIINTRSSLALTQANIDQSEWRLVNMTGDEEMEKNITKRLIHNRLSSNGIPLSQVKITGQP